MENIKILIVDDSKLNRTILKEFVKIFQRTYSNKNIDILEAENGLIAVDLSKIEKPQLIFMDIMMPIMDGIEATDKIMKENKNIKIIAVSASQEEEHKRNILKAGAIDFVYKPINGNLILEKLNYLI